jgi:putative sugar O-methyltransferase
MFNRIKPVAADLAADLLALLLRAGGERAYRDAVNALWERQPVYSKLDIRMSLPEPVAPDPSELPLVKRIFEAFRRAKRDQEQQSSFLLPAGGWKRVIDSAYAHLIEGCEQNDIGRFHYFLANFGSWQQQTGIEESWAFHKVAASERKRAHYEQQIVGQLIHWWTTFESDGRDLSALRMPNYGNQAGARVDGHLMTPNAIYSDFYARLLAGLVNSTRPLIAELGGGYGRLMYFLSRHIGDFVYVGLDLPETLCCAAYYLMKAFPEKRTLLYGEADMNGARISEYDLVLLPSFEIERLADRSVELFLNENSLGVMPPEAARYYVTQMCRTAETIWHRNHEVRRNRFENGCASLIKREYPIDRGQFTQVLRYCDIERLIGQTLATSKNDMYWYYFKRRIVGRGISEG